MTGMYYDARWCAPHGIGRFATEVRNRLSGWDDLPLDGSPTSPSDSWRLAKCLKQNKASIYFSPGYNVPLYASCPVVATVHDLIHLHCADETSIAKRAYYRYVQRPMIRRSPVTLTVSEFSRQEIIDWYDIAESQVVVVGNGVSEEFKPDEIALPSKRPYFYFVGNTKPHKNVESLVKAFAIVAEKYGDVELKLVAKPSDAIRRLVALTPVKDRIEWIRGASDVKLAEQYRGAVATVLPSFFEGFGLPLVEAMACGCPVIASDRTSIPEVVGDAGILFDPNNIDHIADCMIRVLDDSELRAAMKQKGLQQAAKFRWSQVGERVRRALQSVAAS
ncbi:D-inositol 3-phosphate glycosyltransferase [Planctomycetes bacterium CA13]|uniref:D-inositol 3-phosphate glycosyltransferase n=1 Tax=Novipirellula herctigrandis TaxID=2527986 RepID=A0A5C5YVY3_9BACT|nr:D-inositol 3-phosphate glycosyltransferase [Planctomycetes bacterium CA13]